MKRTRPVDQSSLDTWFTKRKAVDEHSDTDDDETWSGDEDLSNPHHQESIIQSPNLEPGADHQPGPSISTAAPLDIGILVKTAGHLRSIDDSTKMKLIRLTPDEKFSYPVKHMHGCNRRFKPEWAKKHPWLHYSQSDDGAYCKACVLFAPADVKRQKLGILVTKPFCIWTKQSSTFNDHEKLNYHQDSIARMTAFKDSCADSTRNVATMLNKAREEQISRNTQVIKSLLKCVAFCGKQGIAFRGHRDDSTATSVTSNMGNFIELVRFRAENDETLRQYLETSPMNALYTSKTIQNEMIEIIGSEVEDRIIKEVNEAKFYAILADEVTDCSNVEQLSLVIRFVDNNKCIREDFLGFIAVERITGECLATELLSWLKSHHIDVTFCRGQGYDGASNMSSSVSGVHARIRSVSPLAFYTHCQSHQLNLCVVKACSIPQIRNANGVITEISKFFNYSPKRQKFFEHTIELESPNETKTKLKDLCRTRWVQRIDSYTVFYDLYPCIIKTMDAISLRGTSEWSWDSETLTKARGFLHQLLSSEFLVTFYVTMTVLSSLRLLTIKLQKKSNDVLAAYDLVAEVITDMELLKTNCEEEFHLWYTDISALANKLEIVITTPRTVSRQVHRSNIPADTPEAYYRRNLMIPFLDHIITELTTRFSGPIQQTKVKLLGLIPYIATTYPDTSITEVGELYKADLPSPQLLLPEFRRWKMKFSSVPLADRPATLQAALQFCEKDDFPNIYTLLVIACTLPVTTCETERSNSQLKLLKTYLRSTMTENRLSSLALIKIHRDIVTELDYDKLVLDFANKHPRRMALPCIFSD